MYRELIVLSTLVFVTGATAASESVRLRSAQLERSLEDTEPFFGLGHFELCLYFQEDRVELAPQSYAKLSRFLRMVRKDPSGVSSINVDVHYGVEGQRHNFASDVRGLRVGNDRLTYLIHEMLAQDAAQFPKLVLTITDGTDHRMEDLRGKAPPASCDAKIYSFPTSE